MISKTQWRRKRLDRFLRDLSLTHPPFLGRDGATHPPASSWCSRAWLGGPRWLASQGYSWRSRIQLTFPTCSGFCRLHAPWGHSSISPALRFLSPLGRVRTDGLLTSSAASRVSLALNKQLPTSVF